MKRSTWNTTATTCTPLRFPGQYYDAETGLHYNYFRHYGPETGRYTTPDPLGLAPAPNPVTYVVNPAIWSDPLGLAPTISRSTRPPSGGRVKFKSPWDTEPKTSRVDLMIPTWMERRISPRSVNSQRNMPSITVKAS